MKKRLKFNGVIKPWLYMLKGFRKAPFPSIDRTTVEVPGMHGVHLTSHRLAPLVIEVPIGFKVENEQDELSIKDDIASWLYTAEPAPLEFIDDEPGRIYYAVVQNTIDDIERMAWLREGTITFLCADPFGYGAERRTNLISGGITTIGNEGTAETYPIFELIVKQNSTRIEIGNLSNLTPQNTGRTIILGTPQEVGQEPIDTKKLVMHDTMKSTSGWVGAANVDNGYVSGTMGVKPDGFYVEQWGDEDEKAVANSWIGPSLQRALPKPLKSFIADTYISSLTAKAPDGTDIVKDVGIVEVYMRDANDNMVCKIQFGDTSDNASRNQGKFDTAGNWVRLQSNPAAAWTDFDGILRIVRDSDYFYPYIAVIKNGEHVAVHDYGTVIPGPGVGTNDVTKIQIAIRKWVGAKRMTIRIKEIKVYETIGMYEFPDNTPTLEFKAGDRLRVDVAKGLVTLNGEDRRDLFNLETDFFGLIEGLNRIQLSDNVEGSVIFRNRFL